MNQDHEPPRILLNIEALGQLDELLTEAGQDNEDDADLFVTLGYVTARAMEPVESDVATWLPALLSQPPAETRQLQALLQQAATAARQGFYQGGGIELPFDNDWQADEDGFITDWCAGFMQGVFEQETLWFDEQEQDIAELLLPIMALSGLFGDEADFAELEADTALMQQFAIQLPELLLDLYCQLNAPEEKPRQPAHDPRKKNRRR